MMNNTTEPTDTTSDFVKEMQIAIQAISITHSLFIVLGTFLNSWLIFSILTLQELREKFRNQLICNMAFLHLTETLVKSPVLITYLMKYRFHPDFATVCAYLAMLTNTDRIQSFIADWLLAILVAVFLAQVLRFDPALILTPLGQRIGKITLHILPWFASLVIIPSVVHFHRKSICLVAPYLSEYVFLAISTITPIASSIIMVTVAAVIKCIRRRSSPSSLGARLIGGVGPNDNTLAYIAAVATSAACEICYLFFHLNLKVNRQYLSISLEAASIVLTDSSVIFMVFPWLLFPDVRDRLKTWRPWYRPGSGIDLAVAYDKETS